MVQALVLQTRGDLPDPGRGRGVHPSTGVPAATRQGTIMAIRRYGDIALLSLTSGDLLGAGVHDPLR